MDSDTCAMAPADWTIKTVESVCERVTSGGTPNRSRPDYYVGGTWPWVKTQELKDGWLVDTEEHINDEAVSSSSAKVLSAGTILVAMYGATVGQLGILRRPMTCNQACCALVPNPLEVENRFLLYQLLNARRQLKSLATGAAQQNLSAQLIKSLRFPFPHLDEQREIARILGALDDKIELNRRMNETLEAIARAIFKSWFVDFDPVRANMEGRQPHGMSAETASLFPASFERSAIGDIPTGWAVGTLADVAENVRRGVSPDKIASSTPYIALEHMPRHSIALSEWTFANELLSNKFQFNRREILFGKLRPYFHKVGVAPVDGVCSTDIVVIAPKGLEWFGFVLGHVSSTSFVDYTNAGSTGTKMPRTSWKEMSRYALAVPPKPLPAAFDALIRPLTERIIASIHESRATAELRNTLLPKLISGDIRIDGTKHHAAEALS